VIWSGSATTPLRGNAEWGYYTDVGATTGLYVRERHLEAGAGRWISADPIGFAGGLNLYGYALNRPLELVDPDGLLVFVPILLGAGVALLIGAVGGGAISGYQAWRSHGDVAAAVRRGALIGGIGGLAGYGATLAIVATFGTGFGVAIAASAAGGLVGNLAEQGVEVFLGCRTGIELWEVLMSGGLSGLGGAIGPLFFQRLMRLVGPSEAGLIRATEVLWPIPRRGHSMAYRPGTRVFYPKALPWVLRYAQQFGGEGPRTDIVTILVSRQWRRPIDARVLPGAFVGREFMAGGYLGAQVDVRRLAGFRIGRPIVRPLSEYQ
jgi:RHS repeat-associated protein